MGKITAESGKVYPKPMEGQHEVMLVQVIDLGTQPSKNPEYEPSRQLELMFEVMDETHEFENKDGTTQTKPFAVWKYTSPYVSKKKDIVTKYHALVNALAGKKLSHEEAQNLDFNQFLGGIYSATIVLAGEYTNIDSFTKASQKLIDGYKDYEVFNPKFVFSLEEFDQKLFNGFNEKKQAKIKASPEYQKAVEGGVFGEEEKEDLPF